MSPLRIRSNRRVVFVALIVLLAAGGLSARLARVQLVERDRYVQWGTDQRIANISLSADRGAIVDRNGADLAVSVPYPTLWADPRLIEDPALAARDLSAVLGSDPIALEARLRRDGAFAYVARQIDPALAEQALNLGLNGVYVLYEPTRLNPAGEGLARSVLGEAGLDSEGVSGIEAQYTELLNGDPGQLLVEQGQAGGTIPDGVFELQPAVPGETLSLTIDRTLQFETERLLAQTVTAERAAHGVVLVADVESGEILAMANVAGGEGQPAHQTGQNLAATMVFEPGSIMKPITFAGLVERGLLSPDEVWSVEPLISFYEGTDDFKEFRDTPPRYERSNWLPYDILAHSSNVGTITVVRERATDVGLHENMEAFGFGAASSLGFRGESGGILPDVDDWDGLTRYTTAIGQGFAVTPLQMLQAYLALANDGVLVGPSLVRGTLDQDGVLTPVDPPTPRRVVSAATARDITEMLTYVLEVGATGEQANVPGYQVAGKTGTAWQILTEDDFDGQYAGQYGEDGARHSIVSFAGYAPAEDPQIAVVVIIDRPTSFEASGGRVAAPLFADVMRVALESMHVPPPEESIEALAPVDGDRVRAEATDPAPPITVPPVTVPLATVPSVAVTTPSGAAAVSSSGAAAVSSSGAAAVSSSGDARAQN